MAARDEYEARRARARRSDSSAPVTSGIDSVGRQTNTDRLHPGTNGPYTVPTLRAADDPDREDAPEVAADADGVSGLSAVDVDAASPSDAGAQAPAAATGNQDAQAKAKGTSKAGGQVQKPDIDTKYTIRQPKSWEVRLGPLPVKVTTRWQASLKDKGTHRVGFAPKYKGDINVGNNELVLERSAKGADAKITSTLVKGGVTFDLLSEGKLPGVLNGLDARVEIKGLEAGLSLRDGASLKLASLVVTLESPGLAVLFPDDIRDVLDIKGQVVFECPLAPDLAHKLYDLGKAADAIKRADSVEKKIATNEHMAKYYRSLRMERQALELEGELTKLRALQGRLHKARDEAIKKVGQLAIDLEKTAGGRLFKKAAGKVFALAFKKLLPIYNFVSTAQDLYEAYEYFKSRDWSSVYDRVRNGGDGGTTLSDGSKHGKDKNAVGGGGTMSGVDEAAGDMSADEIARELDEEANPQLHAAAKEVLGAIEKNGTSGPTGVKLSADQKSTLNAVIPTDLTPEEISMLKTRLSTTSSKQQDLVESVIEGMQQVRPLGEKRIGPPKNAPTDEKQTADRRDASAANASAHPLHQPKDAGQEHGDARTTMVVDPAETLGKLIKADELGHVEVPALVKFPGFEANVRLTGVSRSSFNTGEEGSETSYLVAVTITPSRRTAPGLFLADGRSVVADSPLEKIIVIVRANRPRS